MRRLPTITRNLLLLNVIVFFLSAMRPFGLDLDSLLGLHYWTADSFHWWQPVTYMFMHADFNHIFFNMFAVLMFAPVLEREWGEKKFIFYYLVCGLGAALAQELVWALMITQGTFPAMYIPHLNTIGASGAVFGILLAFGWLFPDVRMFIFLIPIPIRARILVIIYAGIELLAGLGSLTGITAADHVAHFAHLGGMVFGLLVLLYWRHGEAKLKAFWDRIRGVDNDSEDRWSDYHYQRKL